MTTDHSNTDSPQNPQRPPGSELPLAELVVVDEGARYKVRKELTTIGRASDCDVILGDDERISRVHAEIRICPRGYFIQDRSHNGTFVNGNRVRRVVLRDGDELRLGQRCINFYVRSPENEVRKRDKKDRRVGTNRALLRALYEEVSNQSVQK
ncbi:MAG: FHA domain-containing protein [Planctomycetes bacterium]|nr:FHA domain-containing protein [Planctomycetota bacterium]